MDQKVISAALQIRQNGRFVNKMSYDCYYFTSLLFFIISFMCQCLPYTFTACTVVLSHSRLYRFLVSIFVMLFLLLGSFSIV